MSLIITVKVSPSSGRSCWVLDKSGMLKCFLTSPPERGLANKELIKTIAKLLKLPQEKVIILAGDTARTKKIKIEKDISYEQFLKKCSLNADKQESIF